MSRRRAALFALSVIVAALALAPSAFATTHGGQGLFGPTDDQQITNAMFILIGLFPVIIIVFSLIQAWLDHRKHARQDAAKHRASAVEWKGGW
jgi:preprotein translocase subunit SecG